MEREPNPGADLLSLIRWIRVLHRISPDVVVVGTPKAGLLGGLAGWVLRVPRRIYELHGLRLESASGIFRKLLRFSERASCAFSHEVVAVSESLRNVVIDERITSNEQVLVVGCGSPNGVDIEHFEDQSADETAKEALRRQLRIDPDEKVVVFVGRLTADKGVGALAEAIAEIDAADPVHLLAIGGIDGPSGVEGMAHLRRVVPRLTIVGEVDDVAPYLAIATLLCLPSRREGLPTVVLEAFAAGVPVVATAATGVVDLVHDGKTGLLAPIDDAQALSRALRRALDDPTIRSDFARESKELVSREYAGDVVRARWVEFLLMGPDDS